MPRSLCVAIPPEAAPSVGNAGAGRRNARRYGGGDCPIASDIVYLAVPAPGRTAVTAPSISPADGLATPRTVPVNAARIERENRPPGRLPSRVTNVGAGQCGRGGDHAAAGKPATDEKSDTQKPEHSILSHRMYPVLRSPGVDRRTGQRLPASGRLSDHPSGRILLRQEGFCSDDVLGGGVVWLDCCAATVLDWVSADAASVNGHAKAGADKTRRSEAAAKMRVILRSPA